MKSKFPTECELAVLRVLSRFLDQRFYGLEIVAHSNGTVKQNAVYSLLARLERKRLVKWHPQRIKGHPGIARPTYTITAMGERMLKVADG
jgi:DNA-binding PadR family transcriptional regulator